MPIISCEIYSGAQSMAVPISNMKSSMKRRAIGTREKPKDILNHELQIRGSLATAQSLSDSAVRKMIRRRRIKAGIPVVEGNEVREIDIPEASKKYTDDSGQEELFVLGDSGKEDPERIILF